MSPYLDDKAAILRIYIHRATYSNATPEYVVTTGNWQLATRSVTSYLVTRLRGTFDVTGYRLQVTTRKKVQ